MEAPVLPLRRVHEGLVYPTMFDKLRRLNLELNGVSSKGKDRVGQLEETENKPAVSAMPKNDAQLVL
jgi:hypothetical protein